MTPSPNYRTLKLTQGYVAFVDASEYKRCAEFKWCARIKRRPDGSIYTVYAHRSLRTTGVRTTQMLHRFILGVSDPKIEVDHKDHNGLNCRRKNLRIATRKQNMGNQRKSRVNTSGYKGVSWHKRIKQWAACICLDRVNKCLGYFDDSKEAARAYDDAALKHFGEFAHINFPKPVTASKPSS